MNQSLAIFLFVYFGISTTYSALVYRFAYKSLDHFILNLIFGPFAIIYNLYLILFRKDIRV